MKIKALAISAISMALLASCGNSGKELPKDATPTDSLSYTLGQMAAMQRSVAFEQDTTLKNDAARKSYDQGFLDGFKIIKGDNEAYNQGLILGMQMAMQMQDLKKQTGIELNRDLVLGGFKGMAKDSLDPREYQKIQERGARLVASIVNEKVKSKVEQAAKGGKYQKQGDLYYKVGNAGSGANLAKGQSVMVRLNVMDTKRNEVIPGLKSQATPWVVGDGQLPVLDKVLPMMKVGSTYEVVASPMQAFGPQTPPMINTSEPVIITVEVVSLADSAAMNAAAAPAPAPGQAAPAQAAPAPAAAPAK